MRRIVTLLLSCAMLSACADQRRICGHIVEPYGLFNPEQKDPNIQYRVSAPGVVVGLLLIETVIAPVLIFGWFLYEPVETRKECHVQDSRKFD